MTEEQSLQQFTRMFFDADEASRDERRESEQARDYFDGKQYTAEELQALRERRQPPTTLNRVARKINHLLGLEVDRRTDPKAYPRNPETDEGAANAVTDSLRYVEQRSQLDQALSRVHECMLIEGYGGCELTVTPVNAGGRQEMEIGVQYWEWSRLFYDPLSVKPDFSDAQYLGGVEWLDLGVAQKMYPDAKEALSDVQSSSGASLTDEYEDEPERKAWVTRGSRPRVRIVHMYYRKDGQWHNVQFTGGGVLEDKPVPFVDQDGNTYCPLFLQSAYVDREGDRYGEVRNLISPQDMINKTHSKMQHWISVRQLIAPKEAFPEDRGGIDGARQELAKPDGALEIIPNFGPDVQILDGNDRVAGLSGLLQEFKQEIDLMGPNASMQGKGPQSQSGRALIAQTEGGLREFNPVADRFDALKERIYRAIWFLIRQYWDYEKAIRVFDDEQKVRFIGLNRPVTRMEIAMQQAEQQGMDPQAVQQQTMAHPVLSQMAGEVVAIENHIPELDMDIIMDKSPNMVTLQAEQFQELAKLAPAMAQAGKPMPIELLIELSSFRDKDKLLKLLEGEDNPQAQAIQEQQMIIAIRKAMAEIAKDESSAAENYASAEKEQAETARILAEPVPQSIPA